MDNQKKSYCLVFAFDELKNLLLIKKNNPVWQAGFWNGIGGKIEPSDSNSKAAAIREFEEEAGIQILESNIFIAGQMSGENWIVDVFAAKVEVHKYKQMTDEEVGIWNADRLPENMIANLPFLIPMCWQVLETKKGNHTFSHFVLKYKDSQF